MDSRERTFLALEHKAADRIPIDFWATPAVIKRLEDKLGRSYGRLLDHYDVDLRYIAGPRYIGPPLGAGRDIWGVQRNLVPPAAGGGTESYREVVAAPLAQAERVEDIENYKYWPNPDWFDYSGVEKQCEAVRQAKRVAVFMGDRLNRVAQLKPAMYLLGAEKIFTDLATRSEIVPAVLGRIRKFYRAYLERILGAAKGKIDIVLTGDDFGAQNGLLISPAMWRAFLADGFKEYLDLIKSYQVVAMHHTCGSVVELIPDMIAGGLDILQSVQPEARGMALADLLNKFGKELCFQGGISIQRTMPYGTPAEIRDEVRRIAGLVGRSGGYIFCTAHNLQADTPLENIAALMDAYREYGRL